MSSASQFNVFLQQMVPIVAVSNTSEVDHVIRRAFALLRLCYRDLPNGFELLDQRLQESIGLSWKDDYEKRNCEEIRNIDSVILSL